MNKVMGAVEKTGRSYKQMEQLATAGGSAKEAQEQFKAAGTTRERADVLFNVISNSAESISAAGAGTTPPANRENTQPKNRKS